MLRNQPGIHSVKVALLAERAVVEYDPELWTAEKIMSVSATICQYLPMRRFLASEHRALHIGAMTFVIRGLFHPQMQRKETAIEGYP